VGASLLANAVGQSPHVQADSTLSRAGSLPQGSLQDLPFVGVAAGCDLLTLLFKDKIKRSQPAAAPTGRAVEFCGQKNAPNQSGRQSCGFAVSFLYDPQRPFAQ